MMKENQVELVDQLLPDASTLVLALVVGLAVNLVPAMFRDHVMERALRKKRETSEEIEEAMINFGMVEVEPPDLSRVKEHIEGRGRFRKYAQNLIDTMAAEALRSDMAARELELVKPDQKPRSAGFADFWKTKSKGPNGFEAYMIRKTKEKQIHMKHKIKATVKKRNFGDPKFISMEKEVMKNFQPDRIPKSSKYQTKFTSQKRNIKPSHPTKGIADFSIQGREGVPVARELRNIPSPAKNQKSKIVDRNRMDRVQDLMYPDRSDQREKQSGSPALRRQASSTSTLDSTTSNQGGILDTAARVFAPIFRLGVAVVFFLS